MTLIPFNLNSYVRVQLTDHGRKVLRDKHEELNRMYPKARLEYTPKPEDKDGWSRWQLWCLMEELGKHIDAGNLTNPFSSCIQIECEESTN